VVTLRRDRVFYAFSPDLEPVLELAQGEDLLLEAHDCFEGQLRSEADLLSDLDWGHVNPATGPVHVRGARPGDILRVDILDLRVGTSSLMVAAPGEGALGDLITVPETILLTHQDAAVVVRDRIRIPMKPMIGVIGVAPARGNVPTGTPGPHGGNMDCALIGKGASLYLPVAVDGALFGAGDFHSVMGDGEVMVCGAETSGEALLRLQVVDFPGLPTPFLQTSDLVVALFSAPTVDEAVAGVTHALARFLTSTVGIPVNDAAMLMSLVGSLRFCQVVDPEKTVRFEFPKWVLAEYGYALASNCPSR
jgi:amidase